ncbi:MAG: TraR/DksA C4-type zinc finger protein [Myxococcota bacterium]
MVPEELTEAQRTELREDLVQLRDELQAFLGQNKSATQAVELDQTKMGRVSRIDAIQVQKMAEANRRDAQTRLQKVMAALNRMEREAYGICGLCEEPIAFKRLKARPEAQSCIACLRELEEESRAGTGDVRPRKKRAPGSA